MYIHGYGSNGNATKGQLLRTMLPQHRVVSPTFDYDHCTPWQIQTQIRETIEKEDVRMIVGSSFGGYHALCATAYFHGVARRRCHHRPRSPGQRLGIAGGDRISQRL